MKAATKRKGLVEALARACEVIPSRAVAPGTRSVRVQTTGASSFTLAVTSLSRSLVESVPGEVAEAGEVVVGAERLHAVVSALSGDVVRMVEKERHLEVSDERKRKFKLALLDPQVFPGVPGPPEAAHAQSITLAASELQRALSRVRHAMSTDPSRMALHAISLDIQNGAVRSVAVDSHRIAVHGRNLIEGKPEHTIMIPGGAVPTILATCATSNADLSFVWAQGDQLRSVHLVHGPRTIAFLLPNAEFPDWQRGAPPPGPYRARVPTPALAECIRALVAADESKEHAMEVRWGDGRIWLSLDAGDDGGAQGEDSLPCETEGQEAKLYVQPSYLIDALRAADEDVTLCTGPGALDGGDALVMMSDSFLEMIMPIVPPKQ